MGKARIRRTLGYISLTILLLVTGFFAWAFLVNYHPRETQTVTALCEPGTPSLPEGQNIRILSWNVQYMAGKNYVFYYDTPEGDGKDTRPSRRDIALTLEAVAGVINDENPDFVLLQEVDDGSTRTDYADQARLLQKLLTRKYPCQADAFYHKSNFIPHPKIMGAVGMKLTTFSRYKLTRGVRHQLPYMTQNFLSQMFYLKRAILEVHVETLSGREFVLLNTHFDAFAQGTSTMEKQVAKSLAILQDYEKKGAHFVFAGDLNLLPPGAQRSRLIPSLQGQYREDTELRPMFAAYRSIPPLAEIEDGTRKRWFTHFPNNPRVSAPDRTIDYIFYSDNLYYMYGYVRQEGTHTISDHLPVVLGVISP